ncbi:MAG TPA: ABC transporter ATP-binding protein, partial [Homoserinimonas sp.]|nr:ABC transporter ATP-binding protein [Homoserinimonas sp.]
MTQTLLRVEGLQVEASSRRGPIRLVDGVSLEVGVGEIVGLVGESGCGKSMTAAAILQLFPTDSVKVSGGEITLEGAGRLDTMSREQLRKVRGVRIGMVFQDPSTYLDPLMTIGKQVAEGMRGRVPAAEQPKRVVTLLSQMGLPDPEHMMKRFPHELSGGQRQRVLIAAALALEPDVLIADEPTTALDVTIQAEILTLLKDLRDRLGLGILLITHDLGVVAEMCDRVYVMYAGRVAERRDVAELFADPRHPYTIGLLHGTLSPDTRPEDMFSIPGSVPDPRAMPKGCRFNT